GQADDSRFELLFESLWQFHLRRAEATGAGFDSARASKAPKARRELLYSLEALCRFSEGSRPALALPESELARASGRILEYGIKHRQALALDPKDGLLKETKKLMAEWNRTPAPSDERLAADWRLYLDRVHALLGVRLS
ncbi:MAG: hypothetical protein NDJ90_14905, partial [Oligoflexia bacterium]|nr:hypothetical protein [Oligoflexia bacterium]